MLIGIRKYIFIPFREIYRNSNTTEDQRKEYNTLALDFYKYLREKFPWVPITSMVHTLVFHFGSYFDNPGGTYNLIDMSSSGLELGYTYS